jgi:hypothetical protein
MAWVLLDIYGLYTGILKDRITVDDGGLSQGEIDKLLFDIKNLGNITNIEIPVCHKCPVKTKRAVILTDKVNLMIVNEDGNSVYKGNVVNDVVICLKCGEKIYLK